MDDRTPDQNAASSGSVDDATAPTKRLGRRSAEESRKTRRKLLDAAVVEFSEKGMSGARIDEIAARAGVTKGAIYTHFDGREDLLVEACRSAIRSLEMMRIAAEATDLAAFIEESARRLISPAARPARMLISELHASAMRSDVIAELLAEWHGEFVKVMRDRIAPDAASPEVIAAGINLLNVALSQIDVYESMNVSRDEMLALVTRLASSLLSDT